MQTCNRRGSRLRVRVCKKRRCRQSRSGGSMQVAYGSPHTFTTILHTRERSLTREREKEREDHLHIYIRKKCLFGLFARSNSSAIYCKRSIFEIFIVSTIIKYPINLQENPDFHNTSLEFKQISLLSHR